MQRLKIFSPVVCFVMILSFFIFSFSAISTAEEQKQEEETPVNKCINCCAGKKKVCINIKADLRLCEAVWQTCIATCKSEGASPSEWSDCWSKSGE